MNKSNKEKTPKKSEVLPKYGSFKRNLLFDLIGGSNEYKKNIEAGLPFFKNTELKELEEKYKNGISWGKINKELSNKGMIVKKATFLKYIQEKNIGSSIAYTKTDKGREALYPPDTIRHINFIQYYYKIFSKSEIKEMMSKVVDEVEELSKNKPTAYDVISELTFNESLMEWVFSYMRPISFPDEDSIVKIIKTAFKEEPDFRDKALSELERFTSEFEVNFNNWIEMLKDHKISFSHALSLKL